MALDPLGDRMKANYEDRYRIGLPRRTYTILRLDGKAFHSYTRGLERPYDRALMADMQATAEFLCGEIQGAAFAYTQSDEISVLLTDFKTESTDAWFDGNLQKMVSVSASLATGKFNALRCGTKTDRLAFFDSRALVIPDRTEVYNYFVWRQKDATRNSLLMLAQSLYSHSEMHQKGWSELHEMCFQKGHNWADLDSQAKRGSLIHRVAETKIVPTRIVNGKTFGGEVVATPFRVQAETLDFLKQRPGFDALIPRYDDFPAVEALDALHLSPEASGKFVAALTDPPAPNDRLREAFARHEREVESR
jgi:tRNA(His) guanylyltransferase